MRIAPLFFTLLIFPLATAQVIPSTNQASPFSVTGCLTKNEGKFLLTDEDGNVFELSGKEPEIEQHLADELEITGQQGEAAAAEPAQNPTPLSVETIKVVFHPIPNGPPPVLDNLEDWQTSTNSTYGLTFRVPKDFASGSSGLLDGGNFADWSDSSAIAVAGHNIPAETYPNSNYGWGEFAISVDPNISTAGLCNQFKWFSQQAASTYVSNGIRYAATETGDAGAGSSSDLLWYHTFQTGLCYEFAFEFHGATSTGIPLVCSTNWVNDHSTSDLINQVMSQIVFSDPHMTRPDADRSSKKEPRVLSFERSPAKADPFNPVTLSWTSEGVDYVQLHYQCVDKLLAGGSAGDLGGGLYGCGNKADQNFPPNGTGSVLLSNFNPAPVDFVLTIEPFVAGQAHPEASKTMRISVSPHPPVPSHHRPAQP